MCCCCISTSEEDPPKIEDPEIEQEPAVCNGQIRRQVTRRLLWKKQSIRTSEDDIAFLGKGSLRHRAIHRRSGKRPALCETSSVKNILIKLSEMGLGRS